MRHLPYALVDVFAEAPFSGNQLAIFPDATGLTTHQMQTLAREMNLSESTFILPSENEAADGVRVRIFTTRQELPFAGHPTLGTASWLYRNHPTLGGAPTISLQLDAGKIPVTFPRGQPPASTFATMHQPDPTFHLTHSPAEVAQALSVPLDDLDPRTPIQTVSTGNPFCIVLFRSVEALSRLASTAALTQPYLDRTGTRFFYCLAATGNPAPAFRARMQFYNAEDPATGSAAGCAISYLVRHGLVPSAHPILIEQGIEINRPALLHVQATLLQAPHQPRITNVLVSGRTIPVASGHVFLP